MNPTPNLPLRAGLLYLAVVATGIFALLVAPSQALPQGIQGTALPHLQARLGLYQAGVASHLAMQVAFLLLPLALYPIFQDVSRTGSVLMVTLAVAAVPVGFQGLLEQLEVVRLLGSAAPGAGPAAEAVEGAIRVALRRAAQAERLASLFWGLWLFPFGWLVIRSGRLPRLLGWGLLSGGVAYTLEVVAPLLSLPAKPLAGWLHLPGSLGEIGCALWLTGQGLGGVGRAGKAVR
ncbi:MAG: DUF4386 domain-containing protein [Holophagaceae bacterium]